MLEQLTQLCLSHFLCDFDPTSKKRKTRDIVRTVAREYFAEEIVEEFLDSSLNHFEALLVSEFNARYAKGTPLRFQIADPTGTGAIVQGFHAKRTSKEIRFQDALHEMEPSEFERLSAVILRILGCRRVFFTPNSHDQGIDAFGYQTIVRTTPYGIAHHLTWIAQAKHYRATAITTANVRELVGSKELLAARVFSTVEKRYKDLQLKRYAPTAIALVTTEEVPSTVRRLAEGAGVFVFAAFDLFHILSPRLKGASVSSIRTLLKHEERSIPTLS